jgi:hypothetical protein
MSIFIEVPFLKAVILDRASDIAAAALVHGPLPGGSARTRGVCFGRPPKLTPEQIALDRRLVNEGTSVREVAKMILKCHPATLYRELSKSSPGSKKAFTLANE